MGLATRCPGKNEGAQGECWLKEGDRLQAAFHFRKALDTNNRQLAAVRLGDLALAMGDPVTALGWYHRGAPYGVFGRVAASRVCELDGGCLQSTEDVLRVFRLGGVARTAASRADGARGARRGLCGARAHRGSESC